MVMLERSYKNARYDRITNTFLYPIASIHIHVSISQLYNLFNNIIDLVSFSCLRKAFQSIILYLLPGVLYNFCKNIRSHLHHFSRHHAVEGSVRCSSKGVES